MIRSGRGDIEFTNSQVKTYFEKYKAAESKVKEANEKIEEVRKGKVRRAKLTYLRDRVGKAAKVKEAAR